MKWFSKFFLGTPAYGVMVITFLLGVVSFFQINSYQADKHHLNTFWLVVGIVLVLVSGYFLYRVTKTTTGGDGGTSV